MCVTDRLESSKTEVLLEINSCPHTASAAVCQTCVNVSAATLITVYMRSPSPCGGIKCISTSTLPPSGWVLNCSDVRHRYICKTCPSAQNEKYSHTVLLNQFSSHMSNIYYKILVTCIFPEHKLLEMATFPLERYVSIYGHNLKHMLIFRHFPSQDKKKYIKMIYT